MTEHSITEVYRVRLSDGTCRSAEALAAMLVRDIEGVNTVSLNRDGLMLALSTGERDVHEDIVRAVVTAGFAPDVVTSAPFERLAEQVRLSVEDVISLEMPEAAPEPYRVPVETTVSQRVRIEVTDGYDPAHLVVAAGVPVEITFTEGHGCLAEVVFESLDIRADLTNGGAVVRIPALKPGVYPFSCGMHMVHGSITAE
jgi:plastocyanin